MTESLTVLRCLLAPMICAAVLCASAVTRAYGDTNPPPKVEIYWPASESFSTAGQNADIWFDRLDSGAELQYISIYGGSLLLGSVERSYGSLTWSNIPAGIFVLTAVALDANGNYGTSAPVRIQIVGPPSNDDWQNAMLIEGTNYLGSSTLLGATAQPLEPLDEYGLARNSIWWRWIAPVSGKFTVFLAGTYFRNQVIITTHPADEYLHEKIFGVAWTNRQQAAITFAAEQGITYWMAAYQDGAVYFPPTEFPMQAGEVTLRLRLANPPPNDDFANPIVLTGASFATNFSTIEAVQSPADQWYHSTPTVWFSWQPPSNGLYQFWVPLAYYGLAVSTGSSLTNLSYVPGKLKDRAGVSSIIFGANDATTYHIAFQDGYPTGDHQLFIEPFPRELNDDFIDRIPTSGTNVVFTGDLSGATPDPGQPSWLGDSLWWSWTAPASGRCRLTNETGSYCRVAVFTGTAVSNLVARFPTNDFGFGKIDFYADAGTTYQVALSSDWKGGVRLTYIAMAPNDDFANRQIISGSNVNISSVLAESTLEPGEPYGMVGGSSIWYEWTAPTTGPFSVFADAILAVYTGSALSNLVLVRPQAGVNPAGAAVHFDAIQGVPYQIQVKAFWSTLRIAPRPPNDDFADRIDISGTNVGIGSGAGATANFLDEYCDHTLWWKWTAPSNGSYTLSTAGSDPYYLVTVRDEVVSDHIDFIGAFWSSNGPSAAHFTATNGEAFSFMFCTSSNAVIHISEHHPPPNDNFADRLLITDTPAEISGTLFGATRETWEGDRFRPPHSVWYSWVAPSNGIYSVSTEGSDLRVNLDIFTGSDPGSLFDALGSSSIPRSDTVFRGIAGTTYQIRISQDDSSEGNFRLHLRPLQPADDGCSEARALAGLSFSISGTNFPNAGANGAPSAACWSWTAPQSGMYTLSISGSNRVTVWQQEPDYWPLDNWFENVLWLQTTQGFSYRFVVDAIGKTGGKFTLDLTYQPPPPNDDFQHRFKITRNRDRLLGTTAGASFEVGEPPLDPLYFEESSGSVWWSWTAPSSGTVLFTLPYLADFFPRVFTGSDIGSLQPVATKWYYDPYGFETITFQAYPGVEYQFAITTIAAPGNFELSFEAFSSFEIIADEHGGIQLRAEGPINTPSVLEASTDLVNWLPISTNFNLTGTLWLSDPDARLFDRRFYRIR